MKFSAIVELAVVLVVGLANVDAAPLETTTLMLRATSCNKAAIDDCASSTGQDSSECFRTLCVNTLQQSVKRQDQCTEDNLLQCAVQDWEQAECKSSILTWRARVVSMIASILTVGIAVCFEQFCL